VARQKLTPQPFTKASALLNPTYSALAGVTGIEFQNSGREVLAIINGSTASTATVNFGIAPDGQSVTPYSVVLPVSNTTPQFLGPFDSKHDQADGNVYIDLSSITGVTVAVLQLPGVS
jgi:hypothetical protein